ncbi:pyrroline-5-carboxylate reductase family protein, partial [Bacillus atrophaeus]|uniref:pyrroline-5-carboxylate reductase family protein n=1 Tax=Bacillus atrophaeus TaxID=1452 RepID=UPI003BF55E75
MKVGFIGCGNMATAIINGITSNNVINGEDVYAFDIYAPATEKLKESLNINVCNCEK